MLDQYRKEIDEIDEALLKLFEKRMDVSRKVGEYKRRHGMEIFVPEREKAVVEKRMELTKNPKYRSFTAELFEDIMRISRGLQSTIVEERKDIFYQAANFEDENLCVVYPGTEGSYSGEALKKCFPHAKKIVNVETFTDAARMVSCGEADFGVLPFENNSSGAIADTLDLIRTENLYIAGEVYVDIRHCLVGVQGASISDVEEIFSHQQGFLQSRSFVASMGANIKCTPMENTAIAAKYVAENNDKRKAAIASRLAAETFGLKILKEDIQENSGNTTRFVVISNHLTSGETCNKISAAFTARHKSGALCDVLSIFARNGINLLHIESRPLKEKDFSYIFHIDFEGNLMSHSVKTVLSQMKESGAEVYILGNYKMQSDEV